MTNDTYEAEEVGGDLSWADTALSLMMLAFVVAVLVASVVVFIGHLYA